MKRFLRLLPVFLLGTAPVIADEVLLKNGGRLKGTILEEGERVVLRLENGTAKFRNEDILRIVRCPDAAVEYKTRAATLGKDATAHWELAQWCAEEGLTGSARIEMEAVIAIDPEHAEARARLGYEKVEGVWVRGEALLVAKGLVKVDGRWVTDAEAMALAEAKLEREAARVEAAKRAAEARAAALASAKAESAGTFQVFRTFPRTWRIRSRHIYFDHCGYYGRGYGYGYGYGYGARKYGPTHGDSSGHSDDAYPGGRSPIKPR